MRATIEVDWHLNVWSERINGSDLSRQAITTYLPTYLPTGVPTGPDHLHLAQGQAKAACLHGCIAGPRQYRREPL